MKRFSDALAQTASSRAFGAANPEKRGAMELTAPFSAMVQ